MYIEGWGDDGVRVRESFFYYNSSDNRLYRVQNLLKLVEVDTSNLAWKVDDSSESFEGTNTERIYQTSVYDYDANCNEDSYEYLSQNVFNDDDKYEYLVESYREVSAPTESTGSYPIKGIENGKIVLTKIVQDKFYESYLVVKDENGKDLFTVPTNGKKDDFTIYRYITITA